MKQIFADLWETDVESPFPGLTTHAYLLTRDSGNVLFYNTGHDHERDAIGELGGADWQLLSHQDELGASILRLHERFGTQLGGHERERDEFARIRTPDRLFDRREVLLDNIEVIPTPGHTPGSTCFLVASPTGKRYLFTGDTLYRGDDGTWKPGYIDGMSDRDSLATSLELLQTLRPDVVLGSAFAGQAGYEEIRPQAWPEKVAPALAQLGLRRA